MKILELQILLFLKIHDLKTRKQVLTYILSVQFFLWFYTIVKKNIVKVCW